MLKRKQNRYYVPEYIRIHSYSHKNNCIGLCLCILVFMYRHTPLYPLYSAPLPPQMGNFRYYLK